MKLITISSLAVIGFALASCNTARSVGDAAGGAVKATGSAVGSVAEGTVDTTKKVGGAIKEDASAAGRVVTGN
ncbi:hypothetical protein [Roseibacillus persicicus]|uniref:Entericidin EcnAB n=1 Tax=Roseibacillus persicicus TaxID=454148 RepID=A0A918WPB1_9BACT|nr:hypothetical protein [Roseibacillus persicicus]MDQ8190639.1 hypothetical protein [Roseibacillus persicicus]GHC61559.1 hypothetical protein GCM10007100_31150 [Roseibacillus persicicus]